MKTIVPQLISGGSVQHAFLGVQPQTVTGVGVKVVTVESGSAAAKAGLKAGDVVTAIDGNATVSSEALRAAIAQHKPGDSITLSIRRNGATKTLKATLGTTHDELTHQRARRREDDGSGGGVHRRDDRVATIVRGEYVATSRPRLRFPSRRGRSRCRAARRR